jgi:hypothetical protein
MPFGARITKAKTKNKKNTYEFKKKYVAGGA